MKLTKEQNLIIKCNAQLIAINAFAGTGKTSTLVEYAKARPDWRFLYIAYNKAMQEEALRKFTKNVECRTLHSLAYEKIGRGLPSGKIGNNRIGDLVAALNLTSDEQLQVKSANSLLTFWLNSDKPRLDINLLSEFMETLSSKEQQQLASSKVAQNRLNLATQLWSMMCDKGNPKVLMPHDGYLKLFHLSKPRFDVDCVMLDEAQDSNDVTLSIVNIAECPHKIVVGDVHQAIYQFRGSKNALAEFQAISDKVFYLTNSFRFNNIIASFASEVLKYFKDEKHPLIGIGDDGEIRLVKKVQDKITKGSTILARRNATLFSLAIEALDQNKKVHFSGGITKYDLGLLTAIANLDIGTIVTHNFVRRFKSLKDLIAYAEDVRENDILMFAKLVKQYSGKDILAAIKRLTALDEWVLSAPLKNIPLCDYVLTTAHRSKGLEFDKVIVADDFNEFYQLIEDDIQPQYLSGTGQLDQLSIINYEQEVNLYYVAITRAKKQLTLVRSAVDKQLPELFGVSDV